MPTKKTSSTTKTTKKTTKTSSVAQTIEANNIQQTVTPVIPEPVKYKRRTYNNNDIVAVTNNTRGTLVYVSKRMQGYEIVWRQYGDTEYMEFGELLSMRNSAKSFFENNWVTFDDKDVIVALGVENFYKCVLDVDNFDSMFNLPPQELQAQISLMTNGMKETVALRAAELIEDGTIDSRKTIKSLEVALKRKLLEEN